MKPRLFNSCRGRQMTFPESQLLLQYFENISTSAFIAADITFLNENVVFEIGYAIGKRKRCILFRNVSLRGERDLANSVGIFDTLGWEEYSTSDEITHRLAKRQRFEPLAFNLEVNHKAPVYIIEPPRRTDAFGILVSRVKKARWMYRAFSPSEDVRLSAMDAIRHVVQSAGVIAPLLSDFAAEQREHNIRALFVAGISVLPRYPHIIIHPSDHIPPADVQRSH